MSRACWYVSQASLPLYPWGNVAGFVCSNFAIAHFSHRYFFIQCVNIWRRRLICGSWLFDCIRLKSVSVIPMVGMIRQKIFLCGRTFRASRILY